MILIFGASYGILASYKFLLAGYDVISVCKKNVKDLIKFETYLKASKSLNAPYSVSRQAYSGNKNFERIDKLILAPGKDYEGDLFKFEKNRLETNKISTLQVNKFFGFK